MATKKYLSLERLEEYDSLIKSKIDEGDKSVKSYVDTIASGKASSSHSHAISDVTNLQSALDAKATQSSLNSHTGNADIHVTTTNKSNWNSAYTHSTSAHAPSNAERNIVVGIQKNGTDLTVDSSTRKVNITVPTTAAEIGAATSGHNHDSKYDAKGSADTALASAKAYADEKVANLLDNSTEAVDSIMELAEAMENNADAIEALETVAASKVPTSRKINGKALTADITLSASDVGADASGSASAVQTNLDTHTSNTTVHITSTERTNWGTAYTHSQAAHAPSNAEKNQNAFSNVKVGSTTVAADTTTDTLTLVAGTNVQITADANADSVTISATDTVYTHPNSGVTAGTYKSVTVNAQGHVTAGSNPTTLAGYGITDAASKTHTHAISDITNLQTTLNNAASAISANTDSISALQTVVSEIQEITSQDIMDLFSN